MCLLLRSDETRYGELLEYLKKVTHEGRDELPKTATYAYEILIRTSRHIGMSTCQVNMFLSRNKRGGRYNLIFNPNGGCENIGE